MDLSQKLLRKRKRKRLRRKRKTFVRRNKN
jgi:hypothetical protein